MDPQEWYANMPPVTKFLFTSAVVTTLAGNFGLVSPMMLILDWSMIWHKFQIWRLATGVAFFGKLGFPFLMNVYFLYNYSLRIETGLYDRRKADYVFMILVHWAVLLVVSFFLSLPMVGLPFVISILYVWCNVNADMIVSFWFGTKFKAMYFPWVLVGFNILLGGSGIAELIGIFVGHCFFFLKYKYPQDFGGAQILETPNFLRTLFPDAAGGVSGFGQAPSTRQAPRDEPRRWGQGHTLGRD